MTNNVVIVGAGWLGKALGNQLFASGLTIQMTTRDSGKAEQRQNWALFNCEHQTVKHNLSLLQAVWIFCIPAGRTSDNQASYRHYLNEAIALAKKMRMKAFILCSTTGVYNDSEGVYRESDIIRPRTDKQKRLLQNELVVTELGHRGKVIRLAGLFGPQRHPGTFFAHKMPRFNAAESVNMLHQTEAIHAMHFIINHLQRMPKILNLVMPDHPTKAEFYRQAAISLNLPSPVFTAKEPKQRIISSQLLTDLGYQFCFDSLEAALQNEQF